MKRQHLQFAAATILTLGRAIGATTGSVVNAVLLETLERLTTAKGEPKTIMMAISDGEPLHERSLAFVVHGTEIRLNHRISSRIEGST
jgi:hypothetical protein